jgi:hypothetical protein
VYIISASNLASFIVFPERQAKPCNCFVVKLDKCSSIGIAVYFKFDDTLHKRGFLNTPDKWVPQPCPEEGDNMYKLPMYPFLGFPLYPHTEVNPHSCVAAFNEAREDITKKVSASNQEDLK